MRYHPVTRRKFIGTSVTAMISLGAVGRSAGSSETGKKEDLLAGFTWIEQSGFRIESEKKVIYFDPIKIQGTPKDADLIFITHSHDDHCSAADVKKLLKDGTKIYTEPASAAKVKSLSASVFIMKPGDKAEEGSIKILTVPSYNINKTNHPKSANFLGFIITLPDGRRVYQAGDTDFIPEMKTIETDIALVPIGGTYSMNADEAAEAIKAIKPKIAVPMHYGYVVGSVKDANHFAEILKGIVDTAVMTKGEALPPRQSGNTNWQGYKY